ncbi:MAG: HEAT repeat domain-containing protein [Coriobacteriia bacterium]|nr:HEAT repeat domain-containing protein [Coriobacteriia bacterium]
MQLRITYEKEVIQIPSKKKVDPLVPADEALGGAADLEVNDSAKSQKATKAKARPVVEVVVDEAASEALGDVALSIEPPDPLTTKTGKASSAKPATEKAKATKAKSTAKGGKHRKTAVAPEPEPGSHSRQVVFDSNDDRFNVADQAIADKAILKRLVDNLAGAERRIRQFSAGALAVVSEKRPDLLAPYVPQIADALHRPEAQTRWESLEALSRIVALNPDAADDAVSGAEASLYDEENGAARLGAVRFLAAYGGLDAKRSVRVWPYIDEAIQVYHGDPEFQDMLIAVIGFASGHPAKQVREALIDRMRFDADNSKGPLQRRAAQIIDLCKK